MKSASKIISSPSEDEFVALTRPLIGLPVSHAWRGHGTAFFLEFGALTPPGPRGNNPKGEAGLMVEWSWRIESSRSVQFGSWSGNLKMDNGIRTLIGRSVEEISLIGRLPELYIHLSAGRWVHTFMTREGGPEWTLFLQGGSWVTLKNGRAVRYATRNV